MVFIDLRTHDAAIAVDHEGSGQGEEISACGAVELFKIDPELMVNAQQDRRQLVDESVLAGRAQAGVTHLSRGRECDRFGARLCGSAGNAVRGVSRDHPVGQWPIAFDDGVSAGRRVAHGGCVGGAGAREAIQPAKADGAPLCAGWFSRLRLTLATPRRKVSARSFLRRL